MESATLALAPASAAPSTLPPFDRLAQELRIMIWALAYEFNIGRLIEVQAIKATRQESSIVHNGSIYTETDLYKFVSKNAKPPTMLHVNKGWRITALQVFKQPHVSIGPVADHTIPGSVFINFEHDIIVPISVGRGQCEWSGVDWDAFGKLPITILALDDRYGQQKELLGSGKFRNFWGRIEKLFLFQNGEENHSFEMDDSIQISHREFCFTAIDSFAAWDKFVWSEFALCTTPSGGLGDVLPENDKAGTKRFLARETEYQSQSMQILELEALERITLPKITLSSSADSGGDKALAEH